MNDAYRNNEGILNEKNEEIKRLRGTIPLELAEIEKKSNEKYLIHLNELSEAEE